jgi:hypothetical protein
VLIAMATEKRAGIITLGCAFVFRGMAQRDQPLFDAHLAAGGKPSSWVLALGAPLVIVGVLFGGGSLLMSSLGVPAYPTVEVGPHQQVHYGLGATAAEARAAADELRSSGFVGDGPADIVVERLVASVVVGVVVRDGAWNEPDSVADASRVRDRLAARAFPGKDVKLALLDDRFGPQKTIEGPALAHLDVHANQTITYAFSLGSLEAERLRDALVAEDFFADDGKGRDAKLARVGEDEVVSFVVGAGRWDDPEVIQGFESLREKLAARGLGDGKLRVDLCDDTFKPRRSLAAK